MDIEPITQQQNGVDEGNANDTLTCMIRCMELGKEQKRATLGSARRPRPSTELGMDCAASAVACAIRREPRQERGRMLRMYSVPVELDGWGRRLRQFRGNGVPNTKVVVEWNDRRIINDRIVDWQRWRRRYRPHSAVVDRKGPIEQSKTVIDLFHRCDVTCAGDVKDDGYRVSLLNVTGRIDGLGNKAEHPPPFIGCIRSGLVHLCRRCTSTCPSLVLSRDKFTVCSTSGLVCLPDEQQLAFTSDFSDHVSDTGHTSAPRYEESGPSADIGLNDGAASCAGEDAGGADDADDDGWFKPAMPNMNDPSANSASNPENARRIAALRAQPKALVSLDEDSGIAVIDLSYEAAADFSWMWEPQAADEPGDLGFGPNWGRNSHLLTTMVDKLIGTGSCSPSARTGTTSLSDTVIHDKIQATNRRNRKRRRDRARGRIAPSIDDQGDLKRLQGTLTDGDRVVIEAILDDLLWDAARRCAVNDAGARESVDAMRLAAKDLISPPNSTATDRISVGVPADSRLSQPMSATSTTVSSLVASFSKFTAPDALTTCPSDSPIGQQTACVHKRLREMLSNNKNKNRNKNGYYHRRSVTETTDTGYNSSVPQHQNVGQTKGQTVAPQPVSTDTAKITRRRRMRRRRTMLPSSQQMQATMEDALKHTGTVPIMWKDVVRHRALTEAILYLWKFVAQSDVARNRRVANGSWTGAPTRHRDVGGPKPTLFQFVLGFLYVASERDLCMRTHILWPKDWWLATHLPRPKDLSHYGTQRNEPRWPTRFLQATRDPMGSVDRMEALAQSLERIGDAPSPSSPLPRVYSSHDLTVGEKALSRALLLYPTNVVPAAHQIATYLRTKTWSRMAESSATDLDQGFAPVGAFWIKDDKRGCAPTATAARKRPKTSGYPSKTNPPTGDKRYPPENGGIPCTIEAGFFAGKDITGSADTVNVGKTDPNMEKLIFCCLYRTDPSATTTGGVMLHLCMRTDIRDTRNLPRQGLRIGAQWTLDTVVGPFKDRRLALAFLARWSGGRMSLDMRRLAASSLSCERPDLVVWYDGQPPTPHVTAPVPVPAHLPVQSRVTRQPRSPFNVHHHSRHHHTDMPSVGDIFFGKAAAADGFLPGDRSSQRPRSHRRNPPPARPPSVHSRGGFADCTAMAITSPGN